MKTTLWDRMLPQARELVLRNKKMMPFQTEVVINHLKDEKYHGWSELPYYIVKLLHERVYGDVFENIDQDEVKMLFEEYYYEL